MSDETEVTNAWVEKAARGWWDWGATMRKATGHGREWDELDEDERALVRSRVRTTLAPVVPDIQAQALEEAADVFEWARDDADYAAFQGWLRGRAIEMRAAALAPGTRRPDGRR